MSELKRFGDDCRAHDFGYDLGFLVEWLNELAYTEKDSLVSHSNKSRKWQRYKLVESALTLLETALTIE